MQKDFCFGLILAYTKWNEFVSPRQSRESRLTYVLIVKAGQAYPQDGIIESII